MTFLKQIGFLLLMAVLGVCSLVLHFNGYPLAWAFQSGEGYWFPIMFAINVVVIGALLAGVFWLLRGFLFGRGRPYLAWFAMVSWVLVWAVVTVDAATKHQALWPGLWHVGSDSLMARVDAAKSADWTPQEIEAQSADKRDAICTKAFLEEEHSLGIVRDGIPVLVHWPKDLAEKKLFEGSACSEDLKAKHQKYTALRKEIHQIVVENDYGLDAIKQINSLFTASMQLRLMAHPDAVSALFGSMKKYKDDPVSGKIDTSELELRVYSNGQIKDHEWVLRPTLTSDKTKAVYINPNIWSASTSDKPEDAWYAWVKQVKTDGHERMDLSKIHCAHKTIAGELVLQKNDKGQLELRTLDGEPAKAEAGTWGGNWVEFVCASKNKQVKLPD
jgi:hypothetical protein